MERLHRRRRTRRQTGDGLHSLQAAGDSLRRRPLRYRAVGGVRRHQLVATYARARPGPRAVRLHLGRACRMLARPPRITLLIWRRFGELS